LKTGVLFFFIFLLKIYCCCKSRKKGLSELKFKAMGNSRFVKIGGKSTLLRIRVINNVGNSQKFGIERKGHKENKLYHPTMD
jgi:hypothetical protein